MKYLSTVKAAPLTIGPEYRAENESSKQVSSLSDKLKIKQLEDNLENLRSRLRGIYYRNQNEIDKDLQIRTLQIENMKYVNYMRQFINEQYPYGFWVNEPDIQYKIQLAGALLDACKRRDPTFSHDILQGIADVSPVSPTLIKSWIEE